jgi:hypothetical protein
MAFVFIFFVYYYVAISFVAWSIASIVCAVSRQSNEFGVYLASGRTECKACTGSNTGRDSVVGSVVDSLRAGR